MVNKDFQFMFAHSYS